MHNAPYISVARGFVKLILQCSNLSGEGLAATPRRARRPEPSFARLVRLPGQPMYYVVPAKAANAKLAEEFVGLATSPRVQAEGIVKLFNWYPGIDAAAIIKWTTTNPRGDDDHYAVIHYGRKTHQIFRYPQSEMRGCGLPERQRNAGGAWIYCRVRLPKSLVPAEFVIDPAASPFGGILDPSPKSVLPMRASAVA